MILKELNSESWEDAKSEIGNSKSETNLEP